MSDRENETPEERDFRSIAMADIYNILDDEEKKAYLRGEALTRYLQWLKDLIESLQSQLVGYEKGVLNRERDWEVKVRRMLRVAQIRQTEIVMLSGDGEDMAHQALRFATQVGILRGAIGVHKEKVMKELEEDEADPTEADLELWSLVEEV